MRRIAKYTLNLCAAVLLCGCYNYTGLPERKPSGLKANMTLAELRGRWRGETLEVTEPIVVGGVVTSSDKAANFYQTFTIEDATGAAEIMAGVRDLHNAYPIGCRICVRLEGCAVGVERGVMQIGLKPASYSNYAVDYFYSKVLLNSHIERSGEMVEVSPLKASYSDLNDKMCGRLVRIEALMLVTDTEDNAEGDSEIATPKPAAWRGYRAFADRGGNRVYTYTSDYADFAAEEVPTTLCNITGILQREKIAGVEGECFVLKLRSKDDCAPSVDSAM